MKCLIPAVGDKVNGTDLVTRVGCPSAHGLALKAMSFRCPLSRGGYSRMEVLFWISDSADPFQLRQIRPNQTKPNQTEMGDARRAPV